MNGLRRNDVKSTNRRLYQKKPRGKLMARGNLKYAFLRFAVAWYACLHSLSPCFYFFTAYVCTQFN
jgi:hypothetical protein